MDTWRERSEMMENSLSILVLGAVSGTTSLLSSWGCGKLQRSLGNETACWLQLTTHKYLGTPCIFPAPLQARPRSQCCVMRRRG